MRIDPLSSEPAFEIPHRQPHAPIPFPTHPAPTGRYLSAGAQRLLPFDIGARDLFERYARRAGGVSADLGFANNFIWLTRMSAFYQVIDHCFCLFGLSGNRLHMLLPPLGEPAHRPAALEACFAAMDAFNPSPSCSQVEYADRDLLQLLGVDGAGAARHWHAEPTPADYLYHSADLIELRGNAYKTKRSEINQFCRAFPAHRLEPLGERHHDAIRALLDGWLAHRLAPLSGPAARAFIASAELERQGIERALEHYPALRLEGLCLWVDECLAGFTFGERINDSVASILVEKTDMDVPGVAQFLFREFARGFADCAYINVGDDMGLENLRRVKMSYRPALFSEKYTLRRLLG